MPTDPITACVHIDAPPERVYEYFTRPEAIVSWMGEYALLEAEPGGRFVVDIKGTPVRGRFLELDPPTGCSSAGATRAPATSRPEPALSRSGSLPTVAAPASNSSTATYRPATSPGMSAAGLTTSPGSRSPPPAATPALTRACHRPCRPKAHHNARPGTATGKRCGVPTTTAPEPSVLRSAPAANRQATPARALPSPPASRRRASRSPPAASMEEPHARPN
jgi:hypothetical protein